MDLLMNAKKKIEIVLTDHLMLPVDDDATLATKKLMLLWCIFSAAVNVVIFHVSIHPITKWLSLVWLATGVGFTIFELYTRTMPELAIKLYCGFCTALLLIYDLATATASTARGWPVLVIVIDLLLVTRVDSAFSKTIVFITYIYLTLTAIESAVRFGLYDLPGFASQADRRDVFKCDTLPCANLLGSVQDYCIYVTVFLLDFYFTRGFAERLYKENQKIEASIHTAEKIAMALSKFDLESAKAELAKTNNQHLPIQLHNAFSNIVRNLTLYRPYLPDALFEDDSATSAGVASFSTSVIPPGTTSPGESKVSVMFTDIQGSTAIWEDCPEGMKKALKIHNNTIRSHLDQSKGYEVKTIGDAFMVAFESVPDAVSCALGIQTDLLNAPWPPELLELEDCQEDRQDCFKVWSGLRVRIGINYGSVEPELNPLTGRFDYFGNTVNVAARVEGASVGGCIAVTQDVIAALNGCTTLQYITVPYGLVPLRGVSKPLQLTLLLPPELRGRKQQIESRLNGTQKSKPPSVMSSAKREKAVSESASTSTVGNESMITGRFELINNATVATISVKTPSGAQDEGYFALNDNISKIVHTLDRTSGTVVTVLGAMVTVGWNTVKKSVTHFENSLKFTSLVGPKKYEHARYVIGLCSGQVGTATVGTSVQRFVTVLGSPIKLSIILANSTSDVATPVLYAPTSMTHYFSNYRSELRVCFRPLMTWDLVGLSRTLTVYELCVSRLTGMDVNSLKMLSATEEHETGNEPNHQTSWCWTGHYWEAFRKTETKLIEEQAIAAGDQVALLSAAVMASGTRKVVVE
eukprot:TRINITY_DN1098_c0_g2_i1.p1 TRINITY_DN1098_c0_g2~~TRINITY_DN1098_c0_g2_i1.p1  ORF type:complete len:808 (+),score=88.74 TRINITY_DN1098_c0_g2_i1:79-2502(+)